MSDPAPFHDAPPQDTETTTEAVSSSQRHTRIVAVANQKGGVGKTTTVINLAACLAELGQTVLVVDLDPQANATSGLGLAKEEGISMYPAMMGETPANDMRRATDYENVHIIPSELDMASSEIEVARMDNYLQCVDAALRSVAETDTYDFMLLDCPPSLGILTMNALAAADSVLVPMQCEYYALEGLSVISKLIDQLRDSGANPRLEVEGILMTMFDARTNLSSDVVCEVNKHFPEKIYNTVIPRNIRLSEAPSFGKPIITYAPQSPGAVAYSLFARDFLERRGITLADDTPETQRPPRIPIFRVKTIDDSDKSA